MILNSSPYEGEYPAEAPGVLEGGKAPGFEVVFAVAGLLTVVYHLRRRG
jgi:PGF-CTERM protein